MIKIDTQVAGIPCQALLSFVPAQRGYREPGGRQLEPDEPAGWELQDILDRGGRKALWLWRKLTDEDVARIEREAGEW